MMFWSRIDLIMTYIISLWSMITPHKGPVIGALCEPEKADEQAIALSVICNTMTLYDVTVMNVLVAVSISRCHLTSIGIPIIKIRRSHDRLIFIMEIPIPGKTVFMLRLGPV